MAKLKSSKGLKVDCPEKADWHFYDFALGGVSDDEIEMIREIWESCADWLVSKYGEESVRKFWSFEKWGFP